MSDKRERPKKFCESCGKHVTSMSEHKKSARHERKTPQAAMPFATKEAVQP